MSKKYMGNMNDKEVVIIILNLEERSYIYNFFPYRKFLTYIF